MNHISTLFKLIPNWFTSQIGIIQLIVSVITTFVSVYTLSVLVRDRKKNKKLEEFNLVISLKEKLFDSVNHRYFMYLCFTNESSLPISILDLALGHTAQIKDNNYSALATALVYSVTITESKRGNENHEVVVYDGSTAQLPIVIQPFSSYGRYIAFYTEEQDSSILYNQYNTLLVQTSRNSMNIELTSCVNFRDYSYTKNNIIEHINADSTHTSSN